MIQAATIIRFPQVAPSVSVDVLRSLAIHIRASGDTSWPVAREFVEYTIGREFRQSVTTQLLRELQLHREFPRLPVTVSLTLSLPHRPSRLFVSRSLASAKRAVEAVLKFHSTRWRYAFVFGEPGIEIVVTD